MNTATEDQWNATATRERALAFDRNITTGFVCFIFGTGVTGHNSTLPDASRLPAGSVAIRLDGTDELTTNGQTWVERVA